MVVVGRVAGAYGVHGWVRVVSHCAPAENLLGYRPWYLAGKGGWRVEEVRDGRPHGKGVVALLASCADREQAQALAGTEVAVRREQLPALAEGEYYWTDLIGLEVVCRDGRSLGRVTGLVETGANDVLVVQGDRERLLPFVPGPVVLAVDLVAGQVRVDWDPDF